jgi:hypothetical protein
VALLVNPFPASQLAPFLNKHDIGLVTDGTNYAQHEFKVPMAVDGPAIIKVQMDPSVSGDLSAGFDLVLETN